MNADAANPRIGEKRIDPRIAKRAIRRRVLAALGVVLLVGGGLWVVYLSPFFDVDEIQFSGVVNASKQRMSEITEDLLGDPMARVDIARASDQIRELPWVKEVNIKRSWWGGDLSVSVVERTPVAVQAIADGYNLVGREGKVLQKIPEPGVFPVIEGVTAAEGWVKEAEPVLATAEHLGRAQDLASRVRAIVLSESGEIFFDLNEGGWVRLGDSREMPEKLRSVRTVLSEVEVRCDQMLDVRSPSVPAMTSEHNC